MNLSESESRLPTYLYNCVACNSPKEVMHSMTLQPDIKCEKCGSSMNRKPQVSGIKFYGSGFYTTDKNESK